MASIRTIPSGLLVIVLGLLCVCVPRAGAQEADAEKAPAEKQDSKEPPDPPDPKKLERKVAKFTRELELARIELRIAELSNQIKLNSCRSGLRKAERAQADQQQALEHFLGHTQPVTLEKAGIELERSANRAEYAKDEFQELEAMYKAEEFAEMTKELVLKRGRRKLELAERDLALERRSFEMVAKHDLPKERRELEQKLESAREALEAAQLELAKEELSAQVSLAKAQHKLQDLERDLEEARGELGQAASAVEQ